MFRAGIWSLVTTPSRSVAGSVGMPYSSSSLLVTLLQGCFAAESPTPNPTLHDHCQYPKVQDKLASFSSNPSPTLFRRDTTLLTGYQSHNHPHRESFNLQKRLYHHQRLSNLLCNDRSHYDVQLHVSRLYSSQNKDKDGDKSQEKDCNPASNNETPTTAEPVVLTLKDGLSTRDAATEFLDQLTDHQRQLIYHTLNIDILRDKYEGTLGSSRLESHHFLSRFGRPATAKEDPTGTLCEISPRWLSARLDEKSPPAPGSAIWTVVVKNALPFVGFGFLDNLIMILAGDYIDLTIGAALGISTMAAAALGNTISDVAGVGSAWYVEAMASKIGLKDPDLTPSQMASGPVRWASNLGRALGVTIGCLLGMFPLLFLPSAKEKAKQTDDAEGDKAGATTDKSKFA
ncbi:Transmembrane protein [Orchesella cincta]|uniref:Transmembrane protein n=1 Tax=Orchesella cincta TaxID=48709 RepID=A0A1D2MRI4_ORCCI|nr:Transmembrane protein [Orchesella cincta]